jgi:hypothetical protein
MTDYSTSAATTANTAADAARGTTTNNDTDISVSKDGSEDDSKDEASDDNKGMGDTLFRAVRDIQNRMSCCIRMAGIEDCHFCDFFGANISIVSMVWDMLTANGLHPKKSRLKHLLWALYFLKVYPKQSPGCLVVGASTGAVDPKTMRKWVWQFIKNIADLADNVVRKFVNSRSHVSHCRLMPPPPVIIATPFQIIFESRLGTHDVGNDCTMTIDGTDFHIPQQGAEERGNAFCIPQVCRKIGAEVQAWR